MKQKKNKKLKFLTVSKILTILIIMVYFYDTVLSDGSCGALWFEVPSNCGIFERIAYNFVGWVMIINILLLIIFLIQVFITKKIKNEDNSKGLNFLFYGFSFLPIIILVLFVYTILHNYFNPDDWDNIPIEKPVIYLYPESQAEISVELNYKGELIYTYPSYNEGWEVTSYPDGKIINKVDGKEYSYLFWEGISDKQWDIKEGFVVKGEDTVDFLQEKLEYMGLIPKEYNEFIVYWYPRMYENKYNLIYFAGDDYIKQAELNILPKPDSILRVFMVYKPLKMKIDIPEQKLEGFERKGFTVIEWGGTEIK